MAEDISPLEGVTPHGEPLEPLEAGLIDMENDVVFAVREKLPMIANIDAKRQTFLNVIDGSFSGFRENGLRVRFEFEKKQFSGYLGIKKEGDGFTLMLKLFEHLETGPQFEFESTTPVPALDEIPEAAVDLFRRFVQDEDR